LHKKSAPLSGGEVGGGGIPQALPRLRGGLSENVGSKLLRGHPVSHQIAQNHHFVGWHLPTLHPTENGLTRYFEGFGYLSLPAGRRNG